MITAQSATGSGCQASEVSGWRHCNARNSTVGGVASIFRLTGGVWLPGIAVIAPPGAAAHWHTSASDNVQTRELYYELPAGSPAGCYHFLVFAATRAFRPTGVVSGPDPAVAWRIDTAPVYVYPRITVALQ